MRSKRKSKLHLGMGMPKLFGEMGPYLVGSNRALENGRTKMDKVVHAIVIHCEDMIFNLDQPGECHVFFV